MSSPVVFAPPPGLRRKSCGILRWRPDPLHSQRRNCGCRFLVCSVKPKKGVVSPITLFSPASNPKNELLKAHRKVCRLKPKKALLARRACSELPGKRHQRKIPVAVVLSLPHLCRRTNCCRLSCCSAPRHAKEALLLPRCCSFRRPFRNRHYSHRLCVAPPQIRSSIAAACRVKDTCVYSEKRVTGPVVLSCPPVAAKVNEPDYSTREMRCCIAFVAERVTVSVPLAVPLPMMLKLLVACGVVVF